METATFQQAGHDLVDWISRYLENVEQYPVLSRAQPGDIREALPDEAPRVGESWDAITADIEHVIVPGLTNWNHPCFFAYFAISGSGP